MEAMMFPGSKQTTNRLFELFLLRFMREPVLAVKSDRNQSVGRMVS